MSLFLSMAMGCSSPSSSGAVLFGAAGIRSAATAIPGAAAEIIETHESDVEASKSGSSKGVVAGPSNIREFAPAESSVATAVEAGTVDLRQIFEDLGPDATLWYQHVQTLANPFFEGRAPGTRGGELAAQYIEFHFKQTGLEPAFKDEHAAQGGYFQPFDFRSPNPDIKVIESAIAIDGERLTDGTDFTVLGNSGSAEVTARVSFVGYGIESGKDDYTNFEKDIDLSGRIALVLRYEPLDEEGKSKWSTSRFSRHASIGPKMKNLADRGAAGIVLVNPPGAEHGKTGLESLKESGRFGRQLDIPVFQVSQDVAEQILKAGDPQKRDLMTWRRLADNGEVKTVHLDDSLRIELTSNLDVNDRLQTMNVAGILRGKGDLADQWVVIGAHYDHVGFGYTGTHPSNVGQLHPGADDNASGIGAMLIAARRLAERYEAGENLRSVLFVAFGAEEAGLHGSKYIVEHSPIDNDSISLMINMDMVGRLRNNNLLVQGTATAEGLVDVLQPLFDSSGLKISATPGGRGPSDHSSFYNEDVPVLFLFTGGHDDYHTPRDQGYTVNPAGAAKVIDLLESIAFEVASRQGKLEFAKDVGEGAHAAAAGPRMGFKVRLGTSPDYTAELETGVRIEAVTAGTSAALAGIQGGDILLTWNGEEIDGPGGLAKFLGEHEPDDKVKIVLRRGEQELTVDVVLQARAEQ